MKRVGMSGPRGAQNREVKCIGYWVLVGESEEMRAREIDPPRRTWEDDIKTDMKEIKREWMDWIHLAESGDYRRTVVDRIMAFRALLNT